MLDIGSGTGTWAAMVAGSDMTSRAIIGLDFSAQMCQAEHKSENASANVPFPTAAQTAVVYSAVPKRRGCDMDAPGELGGERIERGATPLSKIYWENNPKTGQGQQFNTCLVNGIF